MLVALAVSVVLIASVLGYTFFSRDDHSQQVPLPSVGEGDDTNGFVEGKGADDEANSDEPEEIVVDVKGAVHQPGVYRLTSDMRVHDAIRIAGGTTDEADIERLNLADFLSDGMAVVVPKKGEESPPELVSSGGSTGLGAGTGKININRATAEELQTLNGIGPSKSEAIVRDREKNGPFKTVDELTRVSGIGEKTLENIRDFITVK